MSAGLVLMNKTAVVMAADSAVTVGNRSAIYNTSQKLFKLSDEIPVAILTFANANFMGVPVELIIKMFANSIRRNNVKYDHLVDYSKAFRYFLVENQTLFNFVSYEKHFVERSAYRFYIDFIERCKHLAKMESHSNLLPSEEEENLDISVEVMTHALKELQEYVERFEKIERFNCASYLKEKYPRIISQTIQKDDDETKSSEHFLNLTRVTDQLEDLFVEFMEREYSFGVNTGIVFAGYGEKELYPSNQCFDLLGFINGKLRYRLTLDGEITLEKPRFVGQYAQKRMSDAFFNGIDSQVEGDIVETYKNYYFKRFTQLDSNLFSEKHFEMLFKIITDSAEVIQKEIFEITRSHWSPIYNAIEVLPQEELADLAENLINVSSIKSKYSVDSDMNSTVGGLADVCILNKIDGFKWYTKKKFNK